MTGDLLRDGFTVVEQAVPRDAVLRARREIGLAIRRYGLTAEEIASCQSGTFFPALRWEPWVTDLLPVNAGHLLGEVEGDLWAWPQILIRFPDEDVEWPQTFHIDAEPDWAAGRRYKGIVGVHLTKVGPDDGGTVVVPGSHLGHHTPGQTEEITARAGDALVFDPRLLHSGSLNLGHEIRMAVFFRLVGEVTP